MENTAHESSTRLLEQADEFARREPTKAVISAFGLGFLLKMLPLGAIVAALIAVALSLLRPALLFLGLLKATEYLRANAPAREASSE